MIRLSTDLPFFTPAAVSKVVQGLCSVSDAKALPAAPDFARLWLHEARRVFSDRLISAADKAWFDGQLKTALEGDMGLKLADVLPGAPAASAIAGGVSVIGQGPIFADFMVPGADVRVYREVQPPGSQPAATDGVDTSSSASSCASGSISALKAVVEDYLAEYNAEQKVPLKLVLFSDALEHVARIARIIRQPQGNALLLGVGGSGRQSLARLACFIAGYQLSTIEITKGYGRDNWREDVKRVLMRAGVEEKPTVFLFNDTQVRFVSQVVEVTMDQTYLCQLLQTGMTSHKLGCFPSSFSSLYVFCRCRSPWNVNWRTWRAC